MTRRALLHISKSLALPLDWITLATVAYGTRGTGKTTLGAVIAEEVTKAGQRFCAIDLKGDWYGLRSTADGKGEGIPVVIFGGEHADLPITPDAGAQVGETVATLGQSCIVDLEHFSKGKRTHFLAAFFEALYHHNRDPLLLFLDEAQSYAPQQLPPKNVDAAICLGAVEDLVKMGRKHGIGLLVTTQRGAGLNKEVSELCDMLVAFRTPGPTDQERVKGWLDANTTKAQRDEVMGKLAGLPTGTAVFASGHPDLQLFGVHAVRRRWTFDSSATPKVGQRKTEPKRLAKPDLEQLKVKMAAAIERAKADDPKALRQRIAQLEKELTKPMPRIAAAVSQDAINKAVDVAVAATTKHLERQHAQERDRWHKMTKQATDLIQKLVRVLNVGPEVTFEMGKLLTIGGQPQPDRELAARLMAQRVTVDIPPPHSTAARIANTVRRGEAALDGKAAHRAAVEAGLTTATALDSPLTKAQQVILDALLAMEELGAKSTRSALQFFAGYSGGHFDNMLGNLRTRGLIAYPAPGTVALTDAGRALANASDAVSTLDELHGVWLRKMDKSRSKILTVLLGFYPQAIPRAELSKRSGYSGGHFDNMVGSLRTLGAIDYPSPGMVVASDALFPEGLR